MIYCAPIKVHVAAKVWYNFSLLFCVSLFMQWFTFRDVYMSHVDKTEDHVSKLQREYQDHWHKYAEALERGEENVKASFFYK